MKNFLKRFWSGFLTTVLTVLIAVVVWLFFTLTVAVLVVASPVLLILAIHGSYKVASLGNATKKFLDDLEGVLEDAENKLS